MADVVVFGSLNSDLVLDVPSLPRPGETALGGRAQRHSGGKGANQAAAARVSALETGAAVEVRLFGRTGDDADGRQLTHVLHEVGVDVRGVVADPVEPTGVAMILVDSHGENQIAVAPGANGTVAAADAERATEELHADDVVVCQLEVPLEAVEALVNLSSLRRARVICNGAPAQAVDPAVLAKLSVLVVNEDEAKTILSVNVGDLDAAASAAKAAGCSVVVTLGGRGAVFASPDGSVAGHLPAPHVTVVDTVGAGDAFVGAFAVAMASGSDLPNAVAAGVAAGSIAVTHHGARASGGTAADPAASEVELLTEGSGRRLVAELLGMEPDRTLVQPLGGGVSNVVLLAHDDHRRVVVKQSLERLQVADEWYAPMSRILTEHAALEVAHRLTPGYVPEPLFVVPDRFALGLDAAPADWTDWKTALLNGKVDSSVASTLGTILAAWHTSTQGGEHLSGRFSEPEPFDLLRVDPYYRATADRMPSAAPQIHELIAAMKVRKTCLVHGDFSPKNILVGPDPSDVWVIDFEVAHLGDPAFDLAFITSHLVIKSLHMPVQAALLDDCAKSVAQSYADSVPDTLVPAWDYVMRHVGALMLARVYGKSPAEYLSESAKRQTSALGELMLNGHASGPESIAQLRQKVTRA